MVIKHCSYRAFSKHGSICDYAVLEDFSLIPALVSLFPILNHFKYGFALAKRSKFYIHPQSWLMVHVLISQLPTQSIFRLCLPLKKCRNNSNNRRSDGVAKHSPGRPNLLSYTVQKREPVLLFQETKFYTRQSFVPRALR